jgi:hypothetical protein
MLERLFPRVIDNTYRGHPAGYWLLAPSVVFKLVIGFNSAVMPGRIASTADAIPLASYPASAAEAVTSLFALGGLDLAVLALFGALALIRYRAMIPLAYLLLLLDQAGTRLLLMIHPIVRSTAASAGPPINLILTAALVAGLLLSLVGRRDSSRSAPVSA